MIRDTIVQRITALVNESSRDELLWISGYVTGLTSSTSFEKSGVAQELSNGSSIHQAASSLTVLYGTETGNAKAIATKAVAALKKCNSSSRVRLRDLAQFDFRQLEKEENVAIVISTQGDGEPPETAKGFYDLLKQNTKDLSTLNFAVLALGSTAYPQFCQTGIEVDGWLEKAGANRLMALVKCDEDFNEDATTWIEELCRMSSGNNKPAEVNGRKLNAATQAKDKKVRQTATAEVQVNILLNEVGSRRQTHHIELLLLSPFHYLPGDAVGIVPHNPKPLVEKILNHIGVSGAVSVTYKNEEFPLQQLLLQKLNINYLSLRTIEKYASLIGCQIPSTRMSFYDLLRIYPVGNTTQFFDALNLLDPIAPRLYTIASSPAAHERQLHLIVLRLPIDGSETQYGLCSDYLSQIAAGAKLELFLHRHRHFTIPVNEQDIIMIGPGTGIAPFRSFIAERDAIGASGRNWLFFDEPDFVHDFYYQTELQAWYETGVLHKISLAWHNSLGEEKRVHQLVEKEGAELWNWVSNGASIFISGEKDPMSTNVENALLRVFQEHGKIDESAAAALLKEMARSGRYAKDVY